MKNNIVIKDMGLLPCEQITSMSVKYKVRGEFVECFGWGSKWILAKCETSLEALKGKIHVCWSNREELS